MGRRARAAEPDRLLRGMLIASDNAAANSTLVALGGSTSGGGQLVNALMRSIGLERTEMYGGYLLGTSLEPTARARRSRHPAERRPQPSWGVGKSTTALDLAQLHRAVWLASAGLGPLGVRAPGSTPAEARYLLYLLAHVQARSKLDRVVARSAGGASCCTRRAGSTRRATTPASSSWRGGLFVAAVMTYRAAGAGRRSDVLAGDVATAALRRFRG